MKAVAFPIYSLFTVHNGSALQHVYAVSPGKLGAVLDVALWKDVGRFDNNCRKHSLWRNFR